MPSSKFIPPHIMWFLELLGELPILCRLLRHVRKRYSATEDYYRLSLLARSKHALVDLVELKKREIRLLIMDLRAVQERLKNAETRMAPSRQKQTSWRCCNHVHSFFRPVCFISNRFRPSLSSPHPHGAPALRRPEFSKDHQTLSR
ncbi:hypothetical protein KW797_03970, partial [Candidatus Parcubacteria bacterium]|nr:hypothetical protein [Candidatus Parcubacteria bacterium]